MGRAYAGVLGPLASFVILSRGVVHGGDASSVVGTAWLGMWAFAAIGYVTGQTAGWIVEQSVRARFAEGQTDREDAARKI